MELFRAMKYRNRNLANAALNSYMHGRSIPPDEGNEMKRR